MLGEDLGLARLARRCRGGPARRQCRAHQHQPPPPGFRIGQVHKGIARIRGVQCTVAQHQRAQVVIGQTIQHAPQVLIGPGEIRHQQHDAAPRGQVFAGGHNAVDAQAAGGGGSDPF